MEKIIRLTNHSAIEVGLTGGSDRPTIMLPIAKKSVYNQEAENLKLWGVDPELGKHFVEGLADTFQVLYFDYEGHLFQHPVNNLTVDHIVKDLLLIADEMNVKSFSYYGYSWLALIGLQLAIRTNRLESLVMGGFPPYNGPYQEMLIVTRKTHTQALNNQNEAAEKSSIETENPDEIDWDNIKVSMDTRVTAQFVALYESLTAFDDRSIHQLLSLPKLAFAGENDTIVYGENFGNVTVDIAGILKKNTTKLCDLGWDVEVLTGSQMDHTKAMQPAVVIPLIKPWFIKQL
ncbi:alpha/beta fold hydrolase [Paenibacillus sp. B2(2019)]|uniref:alpha/beta fold hydrolase n=1 Tax=Paenibacillus sp. B2(2019) TaxID=2607754 RepID=UPI0011F2EC69|nr:alpha/beta hydrolase [Paenibacillus sp. B2(2019)]KAA1186476.1 alpha/beta hydrolase [Paenibacillus sp. B2(2019)]